MQEEVDARAPVRRRGRRLLPAACSRSTGSRCTAATSSSASRAPTARVGKVVTKGGLELDCDMVVIGAGVMPDVMLAQGAGLELGRGRRSALLVAAGELGARASTPRATSASTTASSTAGTLRVEHWDVAFNQGKTAALNMLGRDVAHDAVPYFFSDLADWASMEYVGPGSGRAGDPRVARRRRLHRLLRGRRAGSPRP